MSMLDERDRKLQELGYPLDRTPKPGAIYQPVVIDGTTAYVAGAVPIDGEDVRYVGRVPSAVPLEEAQAAAALCAANLLRMLRRELGTLGRIERLLRLCCYVNSDEGFTQQHLVANGASQLMLDVLGDAGWHARTALGLANLPLGCAVEVDLIAKVRP